MAKTLTHSQINTILRKCQKRLRLSDWDVTINLVSANQMKTSGAIAECQFSIQDMEAVIRILNPKENMYTGNSAQNIEASIYHELLHIIITPNLSESCPNEHEEQIIERIAKALVGI